MFARSSFEGANHEAMEASAERILLISTDTVSVCSSSGGYTSDAETTTGSQQSDGSSVDDSPSDVTSASSPSGGDSVSSSSSDSGADDSLDIEGEISFLQQKQHLLRRAISAMKQEEVYDVSKARETVAGTLQQRNCSLWSEAKEVLEILEGRDGKITPVSQSSDSEPEKRETEEIETPRAYKRPRIDISSVICMSSSSLDSDGGIGVGVGMGMLPNKFERVVRTMPFAFTGPWMAKALSRAIPSLPSNPTSSPICGWEVMNDPDLGLLVVPPSQCPFQNGIQLKDALALTSDAQLISLSTPPFLVIHANKAFGLFSGLSSKDIIGKPVESVLQVAQQQDQDAAGSSSSWSGDGALKSHIVASHKSCQLVVLPVTDSHRNPQGGMSHLLVKVHPASPVTATATDSEESVPDVVVVEGRGVTSSSSRRWLTPERTSSYKQQR